MTNDDGSKSELKYCPHRGHLSFNQWSSALRPATNDRNHYVQFKPQDTFYGPTPRHYPDIQNSPRPERKNLIISKKHLMPLKFIVRSTRNELNLNYR